MDNVGDSGVMPAAGRSCGSCGFPLTAAARFCSECGRRVAYGAHVAAEYKQVTVVFADVVHSMDIAAAVGAERLREIMAALTDRCGTAVTRFGGTVGGFTGDGIMGVFGAPAALEDHALRACRAALAIQEDAERLALDVRGKDGVDLKLRVGLNSGEVIAGEIGSGPFGFTTIGEGVGMAQRMESVAPPGGVMLSASTARLVDGVAALGDPEFVRIKGADEPVVGHRLMGVKERHATVGRAEVNLVGRKGEMSAVEGMLTRARGGSGAVVGVVGPPGIGKSRLVREVSAIAVAGDVEVVTAFCESHTTQVPFRAGARLLSAATGVEELDVRSARDRVRTQFADADPEDLVLLDDLLGIADPTAPIPAIEPDARRRRLTALVSAAWLARRTPAVYVIEDVHWIDEASEALVAEFLTVIPQTPSLVLVTYRPEYRGALSRVAGAQAIALAPLRDSETVALVAELLGGHPSVSELTSTVSERAAGNPFFAEEIVRDLAERGVLRGMPGEYVSTARVADVAVPATLQAAIAARIDRLSPAAKRTANAAAVIGLRFTAELISFLGVDPCTDELVKAQLVDELEPKHPAEYTFRHPLIRTVAYESQLRSTRCEMHRRLAVAIEKRAPRSADDNAALIAEHLEAAGDLRVAFDWHMRAGAWSTNRDIGAARLSWQRAKSAADRSRSDDPDRASMRIAPRTLLCATAWRVGGSVADTGIGELRELTAAAGDKRSLAMGMCGLLLTQAFHGEFRQSARLASEYADVLDSIGDPVMTVGLLFGAIAAKWEAGESSAALQLAQRVIDSAHGDPAMGNFIVGSPLALALALRGSARSCIGHPDWKDDLDAAAAMARPFDPFSRVLVVMFRSLTVGYGALLPEAVEQETAQALAIAERSGDDFTLANACLARGACLIQDGHDRACGFDLLATVRRAAEHQRFTVSAVWFTDIQLAKEKARTGDTDAAIELSRNVVDALIEAGNMIWSGLATSTLVESLLQRGSIADLRDAQSAIDRLAAVPTEPGFVLHALPLLRLRALVAHACGDESGYHDLRERYRAMADALGFEGHVKQAEAMY